MCRSRHCCRPARTNSVVPGSLRRTPRNTSHVLPLRPRPFSASPDLAVRVTKVLLSLHVVVAIVAIGPVTVAASMFPRFVRQAYAAARGDGRAVTVLRALHRICRVYTLLGVLVPVFGFATAASLGVLGDAWLIISVVLTGVAAVVLAVVVLPGQRDAIEAIETAEAGATPGPGSGTDRVAVGRKVGAQLGMASGIFSLLWTVVVVLMIVRPGSTTGA